MTIIIVDQADTRIEWESWHIHFLLCSVRSRCCSWGNGIVYFDLLRNFKLALCTLRRYNRYNIIRY